MTRSAESSIASETTGLKPLALTLPSGTGTRLGEIGSGRPLTVSAQLADMRPEEVDRRVEAALQRCSGRPPIFETRMMFPNDGPAYRVVTGVRWECPADKIAEAASVVEGSFRAAPADKISAALYKLRMMTRGREQRSESDQEAETIIWIEHLRCYPGDIVLAVLRDWPTRKDGQWWPTWHDVQEALRQALDKRRAILNHVRSIAANDRPKALEQHPPSAEQRARAVERWEAMRAEMTKPEDNGKPKESPEDALKRLAAMKDQPVAIGEGLAAKLAEMTGGSDA